MLGFGAFVFLPSALYLGEKNLPYAGPLFRVFRGELEPADYAQPIRGKPLCRSGSSRAWGIHNIFRKPETGEGIGVSEISLAYSYLQAEYILQDKRGSDNAAADAFSL